MKKKIIISISCIVVVCILALAIFLPRNSKEDMDSKLNIKEDSNMTTKLYYDLEGRVIYTDNLDNVTFTYEGVTKELRSWLKEDKDFISVFLGELKLTDTYRDGGSKNYQYEDITVIECHTKDGNNNIHIGENLKYEGNVCKMPNSRKKYNNEKIFLDNLINDLGSHITSEVITPHEKFLSDIISVKESPIYSKVMINDNNDIYVIIKTDNTEILNSLNSYFKANYENKFYTTKIADNYYIYLANNTDIPLKYIEIEGTVRSVTNSNILIEDKTKNEYLVSHSFDIDLKVGNKVKVIYNGNVNESEPPRIGATYLEIIK